MKSVKNTLLIVIAVTLLLTVGVIGFIYQMFSNYRKSDYFKNIAVSLDQLGNVVCGALFDMILIKNGTAFGGVDDTVSEILAKQEDNLTWLGLLISKILNNLDYKHLRKSIIE